MMAPVRVAKFVAAPPPMGATITWPVLLPAYNRPAGSKAIPSGLFNAVAYVVTSPLGVILDTIPALTWAAYMFPDVSPVIPETPARVAIKVLLPPR